MRLSLRRGSMGSSRRGTMLIQKPRYVVPVSAYSLDSSASNWIMMVSRPGSPAILASTICTGPTRSVSSE